MSKYPSVLSFLLVSMTILTSCTSPAASDPVSDDGFVTIPGGTYSVDCDEQGNKCREITIETFDIGQYEVAFDEWDECVKDGLCAYSPDDNGWGRERMPVMNVSLEDIYVGFLPWKNLSPDFSYSLPTHNQYLTVSHLDEESNPYEAKKCPVLSSTHEIESCDPNSLGVHNLYGNVGEWTFTKSRSNADLGATLYWVVGRSYDNFRGVNFLDEVRPGVRDKRLGFRLVRTPR